MGKTSLYRDSMYFLIAVIVILVGILAYLDCIQCKQNKEIKELTPTKEGFISSGVDGAFYNENNNSIQGNSLYSNQMIQNNQSWGDVVNTAKNKHIASDGTNTLGAGPGNGFNEAYKAQRKLAEAWESVRNGYMPQEEYEKLAKTINITTSPQSDTSLLNRGNQNAGKMNILPNKLVCVIDEKYMDERSKNRNVYKANTIVHAQGYDIDTNNVGRALSDSHFSKYLMNNNGHRKITSAGASSGGLKVVDMNDGYYENKENVENFKSRLNKEGFNNEQHTDGYNIVKDSTDGNMWYQRI